MQARRLAAEQVLRRVRWSNVPVPEWHIAALITTCVLHLALPVRLNVRRWWRRALGWGALITGAVLAARAVAEIGELDSDAPSRLITTGPYARSRNPMYVAWTLIDLGLVLLINSGWGLVCLPVALAMTHRAIRGEERRLDARFGTRYRRYCERVPRYLCGPCVSPCRRY